MFLMRLIVLLVIVAILLWLLKRLFSPSPPPQRLEAQGSEDMRQCKYCGVHVPESSVVVRDNESYCCAEHAELDRQ